MKELYIAMQEAKWEGTSNEFLTWWMHNQANKIDKKNKELTGINTPEGTKIISYKEKLNEDNNNISSTMDNNRTTQKNKKS